MSANISRGAAQPFVMVLQLSTTKQPIRGNSTVPGHLGWIGISSATIAGIAVTPNSGSAQGGGGGGAARANIHNLNLVANIDSASPVLFQAAVAGEPLKIASLELLEYAANVNHPPKLLRRLTVTGGTLAAKAHGSGTVEIICVGGKVS